MPVGDLLEKYNYLIEKIAKLPNKWLEIVVNLVFPCYRMNFSRISTEKLAKFRNKVRCDVLTHGMHRQHT